jgi:hypothetical protein
MIDLDERKNYFADTIELSDEIPELFEPLPEIVVPENLEPKPFYLIRATALPILDEIRTIVQDSGVSIVSEQPIDQFEKLARYLYPVDPEQSKTFLWLMLSRKVSNYNQACAFILDSAHLEDYDFVLEVKRKVRWIIGRTYYNLIYRDEPITINLHHIHSPDFDDIRKEYNYLMHFVES